MRILLVFRRCWNTDFQSNLTGIPSRLLIWETSVHAEIASGPVWETSLHAEGPLGPTNFILVRTSIESKDVPRVPWTCTK